MSIYHRGTIFGSDIESLIVTNVSILLISLLWEHTTRHSRHKHETSACSYIQCLLSLPSSNWGTNKRQVSTGTTSSGCLVRTREEEDQSRQKAEVEGVGTKTGKTYTADQLPYVTWTLATTTGTTHPLPSQGTTHQSQWLYYRTSIWPSLTVGVV